MSLVKHERAGARQILLIVHMSLSKKKQFSFVMLWTGMNEVCREIRNMKF